MSSKANRRIRVLNGARAILEVFQGFPWRCCFVGEWPAYVIGGKVPHGLNLFVMPKPGALLPPNNEITNILCRYQSVKFKFCLEGGKLIYVDIGGGIPAGKQNWCYVEFSPIQYLTPGFVNNVVETSGIPTSPLFRLIEIVNDLIDRCNSLLVHSQNLWLPRKWSRDCVAYLQLFLKSQIPSQGQEALPYLQRLLPLLFGLSLRVDLHNISTLTILVQKIALKIESQSPIPQLIDHRGDEEVQVPAPVALVAGPLPEPQGVDEDEYDDESNDWVEVTLSTGVIKTPAADLCVSDEPVEDEAADYVLLDEEK